MNKAAMLGIFFRSLTIQTSFNFRTMQGLGFACSMLPLTMAAGKAAEKEWKEAFLLRHLQMFSTNPYLFPAVIGSSVRIEEEGRGAGEAQDFKKALMGPYAAIGDSFFWGALRPFSSAWSVLVAISGSFYAPLMFLFLFFPAQALVRAGGFISGWHSGRGGFHYIRSLDLPRESSWLRYGSLVTLTILSVVLIAAFGERGVFLTAIPARWITGAVILLFALVGLRRGIAADVILYGIAVLCMVLSI